MNPTYIWGFLCGLGVVALACILIRFVFRKKAWARCGEYDERQRAIQGQAYKYAFFTLLIALLLGGIAEEMAGVHPVDLFTFAVLCMWPALCVFATYCIVKDAYIALNARRRALIVLFLLIGAINIVIAVTGDGFVCAGALDSSVTNLVTGIATFYVGGALCVKDVCERRRGDEE